MVQFLETEFEKDVAVLYFYCRYKEPAQNSATKVMEALIKQLTQHQSKISPELQSLQHS